MDSPGKNLEWVVIPLSKESSQSQGSNPGLPHCKQILYHLSHQGSPQTHVYFLAPVVGWKIISFAYCIIITKEKEWYQDKTEAHYPMFQREEINHSRNCPHVKFQISVKESESHSVVSTSLKFFGHSPWNSLGQNTGVGSLFLLQGIFPSQGSSPGLLHCRWMFYQLSHQGSPSAVLNQWLVII